jgi:hypothetical protein
VNHEVLLADLLVTIHLAFVAFVVVAQLLILVGWLARWGWVRNFWFRAVHLLCIAFVAVEAVGGIQCPLTTWEHDLRKVHHDRQRNINATEIWVTSAQSPAAAPWMLYLRTVRSFQLDEPASSLHYLEGSSRMAVFANHILFYQGGQEEMKWFQRGHIGFGVLVLVTFFLVLPRLPRWGKTSRIADSGLQIAD